MLIVYIALGLAIVAMPVLALMRRRPGAPPLLNGPQRRMIQLICGLIAAVFGALGFFASQHTTGAATFIIGVCMILEGMLQKR